MFKLKTKAITTDRNGKTYTHDVFIKASDWEGEKSVIIKIDQTPGSWYLSTLLGKGDFAGKPVGKTISIDMGQNWDCINMDKIMGEVKSYFGTRIDPKDFSPIPDPSMGSYYRNELARLQTSEYAKTVLLSDGEGNKTKTLDLNLESIPVLLEYLNKELTRLNRKAG